MKRRLLSSITALACSLAMQGQVQAQQQPFGGKVGRTLAQSTEWWPEPARAPAGAPNVVLILLDDVGFGATSAFGGVIATPRLDQLAQQGLRYTNFHTTAICAPTRSALLTGRNSSSVHEAGFSHIILSAGFPGWDGRIPSEDGTLAEILRANGYNTFAVYPSRFSPAGVKPFNENAWRLYNLNVDYTERVDLAKQYPEKLAALKALFEQQAQEHNLYPLITWDDVQRIHQQKTGD